MPDLHLADRMARLQGDLARLQEERADATRAHLATVERLTARAQRAEYEASRLAAANRLLVAICLTLCAGLLASVAAWSVWGP